MPGCSAWITSIPFQTLYWLVEKCVCGAGGGSQEVLLCADLVTTSQDQGQWKWHTLVEVNSTNDRGRNGSFGLKSLRVASIVKVFATLDGRPNTTHYIDPLWYMDQREWLWRWIRSVLISRACCSTSSKSVPFKSSLIRRYTLPVNLQSHPFGAL